MFRLFCRFAILDVADVYRTAAIHSGVYSIPIEIALWSPNKRLLRKTNNNYNNIAD